MQQDLVLSTTRPIQEIKLEQFSQLKKKLGLAGIETTLFTGYPAKQVSGISTEDMLKQRHWSSKSSRKKSITISLPMIKQHCFNIDYMAVWN